MVAKSAAALGQLFIGLLRGVLGPAIEQQSWDYLKHGEDWGGLCRTGSRQSPINIDTSSVKGYFGDPLHFYGYNREVPVRVEVDTDQYTVRVTPLEEEKPGIYGGGLPGYYIMDSMHFHWPAEHTINGNRDVLEAHLVHRNIIYDNYTQATNDPQGVAVLGVLYSSSVINLRNPELKKIVKSALNGSTTTLNFFNILPDDKSTFYRYKGSLTTPNCAESVIWVVFTSPHYVPTQLVQKFRLLLKENRFVDTYRNVQPLNGRRVNFWVGSNYPNDVRNHL